MIVRRPVSMAPKAQVEYLRRVEVLIHSLEGVLTPDDLAEVRQLVTHGEPPEALCSLAWVIERRGIAIPIEAKRQIIELTGGMVAREHLPESFRDFVLR